MPARGRSGGITRRGFLGAVLAGAVGLGASRVGEAAVKVGERPARLNLTSLTGESTLLPEAYRHRVLVVHFWTSWCSHCLAEMEALEALFVEYRERGLTPVSVNVGESRSTVERTLRGRAVGYPILLDGDSAAARRYGVTGIPTTFLLDRDGVVRHKVLGRIEREPLRRMIKGLL
jgi:thiol-disulfide isomerase/thioredoxin